MSTNDSSSRDVRSQYRTQDTLRQLLMQDYALGQLYAIHKDLKADISREFEAGESKQISNEQGVKLGSVSMSQPKKTVVPDDDSVLLGYAAAHGYEIEDRLPAYGTPEYNKVIDLIYAAGREDELLGASISPDDEDKILKKLTAGYRETGEVEPGWTVIDASKPRFTLRKGDTPEAKRALDHFTAPLREALAIPEFKQIEEGDK